MSCSPLPGEFHEEHLQVFRISHKGGFSSRSDRIANQFFNPPSILLHGQSRKAGMSVLLTHILLTSSRIHAVFPCILTTKILATILWHAVLHERSWRRTFNNRYSREYWVSFLATLRYAITSAETDTSKLNFERSKTDQDEFFESAWLACTIACNSQIANWPSIRFCHELRDITRRSLFGLILNRSKSGIIDKEEKFFKRWPLFGVICSVR